MTGEPPTLSLCIPTHNRARFLEYLLNRFLEWPALPFGYEIVVSDNASSDDTKEVVEKALARLPHLRYLRHETVLPLSHS
jgi:glycosyltransferase involved in cell wall biosynthesis